MNPGTQIVTDLADKRQFQSHFRQGLADLIAGAYRAEFWVFMAHHELRQRYRRSFIGPFWVTISTGVIVAAIGTIYGSMLGADVTHYLPHLAISFVLWAFISQSILDGCQIFVAAAGAMQQVKLPRSAFLFKSLYTDVLLLAHNGIVAVLALLVFQVPLSWWMLFAPIGVALLIANAGWMALVSGILCARFRDVPPIISSAVQLAFFATPVMWAPSALPEHLWFVKLNPFFHFLAIVRDPLLGHAAPMLSIVVSCALAVMGWMLAILMLGRARRRLVFWI